MYETRSGFINGIVILFVKILYKYWDITFFCMVGDKPVQEGEGRSLLFFLGGGGAGLDGVGLPLCVFLCLCEIISRPLIGQKGNILVGFLKMTVSCCHF